MIIGLSGYAQSGKDTVASLIPNYQRRAFADGIRDALMALDPMVDPFTCLSELIKREGWEGGKVKNPEVRRLLQVMGTEIGREMIDPDIWVKIATKKLFPGDRVIFTDVRFRNEAVAIKRLNGSIWRVNRPGVGAINSHPSESSMDEWNYDLIIDNYGSLTDLRSQLPFMA